MPWPGGRYGQALDVEVDQIARTLVFVALNRRRRVERAQAIHFRRGAKFGRWWPGLDRVRGDSPAVPAQPAKSKNLFQ